MSDDIPTLRDRFAMHAINSILTTQKLAGPLDSTSKLQNGEMRLLAETAYRLADVMLEARKDRSEQKPRT